MFDFGFDVCSQKILQNMKHILLTISLILGATAASAVSHSEAFFDTD